MGKINMKLMQGIEDTENQIQKDKQQDTNQGRTKDVDKPCKSIQKSQKALKRSKIRKDVEKNQKTENKPNTKPQKQVFSFRANLSDISIWKAYATAAGKTMENIGTAAINEYIRRHRLNEAEQAVFEALEAREKGVSEQKGGR